MHAYVRARRVQDCRGAAVAYCSSRQAAVLACSASLCACASILVCVCVSARGSIVLLDVPQLRSARQVKLRLLQVVCVCVRMRV